MQGQCHTVWRVDDVVVGRAQVESSGKVGVAVCKRHLSKRKRAEDLRSGVLKLLASGCRCQRDVPQKRGQLRN